MKLGVLFQPPPSTEGFLIYSTLSVYTTLSCTETGRILEIKDPYIALSWAGIAQSALRISTGQTVRGSNPGVGLRFSAPVQTDPGAHPVSYTMGTESLPGVKRPGRGVDHPSPYLAPRLKKR